MPIYEYQCEHCCHQLEVLQKISESPLILCPECKQNSLKKLVSASRFVLKGQGWYETDFKQKPESADKNNKKDVAEKKKTEKTTETSGTTAKDSSKTTKAAVTSEKTQKPA